ncbi:MAG: NAD(P)-dependent oxidoreductase [Actinobacteria bacterium]|nr:NAD(P)-dependent oxidoreductase [Actinomycetota bacterium]
MAKLAFLGIGQMGEPMAGRLLGAGHEVTVWNRTRSKTDGLAARGAAVADSPLDAAVGAEAAFTMVADPDALYAVVFGDDGLLAGMGAGSTLVEMSTVGPGPVRAVAARLPEGVSMLDAPVLGSTPAAEEGSLKVIVGGERDTFERWREVLEIFGRTTYIGGPGAGASMKLVANSALGFAMTGLGEALSLAAKDLGLVHEAADEARAALRVATAARTWFEDAEAAGMGDMDYPAVIRYIRESG